MRFSTEFSVDDKLQVTNHNITESHTLLFHLCKSSLLSRTLLLTHFAYLFLDFLGVLPLSIHVVVSRPILVLPWNDKSNALLSLSAGFNAL